MKKIFLHNRDNAKLTLVSEDEKLWKLNVDEAHKYVFEYCRIGYMNDNKTIEFVDPSGGPFLSIGQKISEDKEIISIINIDDEICIVTK